MAFTVAAAFEQFCKNLKYSVDNLSKFSSRYIVDAAEISTDELQTYRIHR